METKRYQSFFEGSNTENRWAQVPSAMELCCSAEEGCLSSSDVLMDIVNVNGSASSNAATATAAACKENSIKRAEQERQPMVRVSQNQNPNQNQHFAFPPFGNSGRKSETDSKELSKTVAESMGLYMNAAREADFGFSAQQGAQCGQCSPGKLYPAGGRGALEDSQASSSGSPKMKGPPPGSFAAGSQIPSTTQAECSSGASSALATALSASSPTQSSISSPTGNNMVTSTTSPTYFGTGCSSIGSPVNPAAGSGVPSLGTQVHRRSSTTCSPIESSTVGSPLGSPLNVMRSPLSSPQSMGSVRSPPSCSTNMRSSVSSPTGSCCTVRPSMSSPPSGVTMAVASPRNAPSSGFPVSSPPSGLGLVQSDTHSPERQESSDFKAFEFPKVENIDGEMYSVGLDQMGMVKYIKNEPDPDFRSMCLGSGGKKCCNVANPPFVAHIKSEPNKEDICLNQHYGEPHQHQHSLGLFPASETTYLSLRDNIDEYSLSGILGPPISSLNGNYEPGVFPSNSLTKGIKQEANDGSYYPENCSNGPTSAIVGVNSGGHSFHYQIGAQGTMSFARHDMRDQTNPLMNLISPVTALMESWKSRPGMPQGVLSSRGEGYPGQNCITDMSSSSLRHTSSTAKVCLVCGDEASGCHYGVVTCGSCKVFFKRAVEGLSTGQHNYLCAGRNDCIIDKIRRKNCPACRVRKCLQAGMNLGARKSKKLGKLKSVNEDSPLQNSKDSGHYLSSEKELSAVTELVPHGPAVSSYLSPSVCSVLELIEPEEVYAGYDNSQPDTSDHLLTSLNRLAGKQMVRMVKWAKVLPGFRTLPIEDQITLIQYSWMCLSSFALSWRSYKHTNAQMLFFAPDLVFNEERMQQSAMYDLCVGMRQVSQEFVRLQLTYEEFLAMKVLLLLSTVPKDGLKNQAAFEEMRVNYIKEMRRAVGKATNNSGQTWQRFFQLTKLLDAMHELVGSLLDFCFYTFRESHVLKVEFPEMLVEIISDQIPKVESGLTHTLFFHKK
ncbi:mineralocorticoid receptor isoform X2 [Clupea harengus]|uniref:Mineralocorticoid receptor isoform X2 n=1 Tax=Clupea harengus TaxID=7950 RepID=A0A6P8ET69_CLUHA|nr:mineralocorticoid receptor isoform X2 [Clupea harengus]